MARLAWVASGAASAVAGWLLRRVIFLRWVWGLVVEAAGGLDDHRVCSAVEGAVEASGAACMRVVAGAMGDSHRAAKARVGGVAFQLPGPLPAYGAAFEIDGEGYKRR